ncbi:hypothetical protein V6N11_023503 [Hibiscus sabdariffa]|uniref:Reverse transcriptase Ty1/copia-type domain-containing protein n=1 Tax=Hibiscus sabdariffa TaxID=183260 RepID=A0ABR2TMM3_9ROSI
MVVRDVLVDDEPGEEAVEQGSVGVDHDQDKQLGLNGGSSSVHVQNCHLMVTRSTKGIFKPKIFFACSTEEPGSVHQALDDPLWKEAVLAEYDALQRNNTWKLVLLPEGRKAVSCKWLFKIKRNADGSMARYKARLVAKGFSQMPGQDYSDTFSLVVKTTTVNVVLSLAVKYGRRLHQVDVNNAFLNGELGEDVYMEQPPGFEVSAVDGSSNYVYILVYIDDIIITRKRDEEVEEVVKSLSEKFALKDLGELSYFLGVEVQRTEGELILSQRKYILELLERTKMTQAKLASTPLIVTSKLTKDEGSLIEDARGFRSIVGALLYLNHTRPDIAFAVNKVAQFMHAPREAHWEAVKRILKYLNGTLNFGLVFRCDKLETGLVAFADADWGSNLNDRRSISGYCVYLGNNLVSWGSKKQKSVSRSTTEAEYRSVADVVSEIVWLKALLTDMGVTMRESPVVWSDNTSTVAMSANPVFHAKSKHVELDIHFIRENVIPSNGPSRISNYDQ